ncbi:hypothetical protein ACIRYZ_34010 [Kitasatospora sp. NPDC101155]|uniref:hypothetical protein n=1 Tax=Kitasatospora sp. NPDC101155 TaxID=3364097 RepID=UPI0038123EE9
MSEPTKPADPTGANPGGTADSTPFMLDGGPKIPLPWGGIDLTPVVSTAQTDGSAGALVAAFGKHDVQVELDTLTAFANKIEALLQAMEGSEAAPYKLEAQNLTQGSFVSGGSAGQFLEAVTLSSTYEKVHTQLVKLHKDFALQIEAMRKAVVGTEGHYRTNEDQTTADQNAVAKSTGVAGTNGPGSQRTGSKL